MSEEEQFAINTLEYVNRWKTSEDKYTLETLNAIDTLLNLIEKQQKEIEELKKDNNHQWEERCRLTFDIEKNFISKDKIRAKIKSLEEKIHIVIPNEYNKVEIMNEFKNEGAVDILKELLEEE